MSTHTLWAKTLTKHGEDVPSSVYSLRQHLLDTAAASMALWDVWLRPGLKEILTDALAPGDPAHARGIVAALAGLHDIGKANPRFQSGHGNRFVPGVVRRVASKLEGEGLSMDVPEACLDGAVRGAREAASRRHETVSQHVVSGMSADPSSRITDDWAGVVVGGHHGTFYGAVDMSGMNAAIEAQLACESLAALTKDETWAAHRDELIDDILAVTGVTRGDLARPLSSSAGVAITLLTGLVIVADWLASDAPHGRPEVPSAEYVATMYAEYRDALPRTVGVYTAPDQPHTAVMQGKGAFRTLQEAGTRIGRGLWIAAETTGAGKTEAAMLRHMNEEEPVLWGLPTRATTDAMWNRIQAMMTGTNNVGALLHGLRGIDAAYLGDKGKALPFSDWAHDILGNIKPLLVPVAVGTVDQVLMGSLRQKWTPVRLLAVANAHVVLDEVHTYDDYQVELVCELLRWWGMTDTRVTLLSASLPQALASRFLSAYSGRPMDAPEAYPMHALLTHEGDLSVECLQSAREYDLDIEKLQVEVTRDTHVRGIAAAAVAQAAAIRAAHPSASIGVVVNRVDTAILIGEMLPDALVLHSRMTASHRKHAAEELARVLGREAGPELREGQVVVGTQVIEASLDFDVDVMVSEVAPAASLIQRGGRVWRFSEPNGGDWEHRNPRPFENPKLVILVPVESGQVTAGTALPYARGALARTLSVLPERVAVPSGVQHLVDTAHYDLATSKGDGAEMAEAVAKIQTAKDVVIGTRSAAGAFKAKPRHSAIARLTTRSEKKDTATRITDMEQVAVMLVGDGENRLSPSMLTARRNIPAESVVELVGLTLRVNANRVGAGKALEPVVEPDDKGNLFFTLDKRNKPRGITELRNVIPVRATSARYDDRLGLVFD